jgi:hypothetical protein
MKGDGRVDEELPAKGAGNMERFLALHEFEPEARQYCRTRCTST